MGKRISQALQLAPSTPALRPVYPQLPGTQSHPFTCQNHIRFHGVDHFIILYVFHLRKHLVADIIYSSGHRHFLAYSFLPHDKIIHKRGRTSFPSCKYIPKTIKPFLLDNKNTTKNPAFSRGANYCQNLRLLLS